MNTKALILLTCFVFSFMLTAEMQSAFADAPPDQVLVNARLQEASRDGQDELGIDTSASGATPSAVTMDKDGNYVLSSGEKLTFREFMNRYPIWSGVVIGPPETSSQGVGNFYYGLSGVNFYRGDLRGFRFSGDDYFGDSYQNPTADPRHERWGRNHYPFGPDIRFRVD